MCGIIGYKGFGMQTEAHKVIFSSLKRLEYRGYDSWGIATLKKDGEIALEKFVGKIRQVELRSLAPAKIGIGHTRWATHGSVTKSNAHPHTDCDGDIALVHNGIVENYEKLKKNLRAKGHKFRSQTDTEVITHLIEEYNKRFPFEAAVVKALGKLEGRYAVIIANNNYDGLIAARNGSPLVMGIAKNGYFAASDIPAFIEHTKKVMYLYDHDVVFLNNSINVYNTTLKKQVRRLIDSVDWSVEQAKKGDFEHFMLKEIAEQIDALKRVLQQDQKALNRAVNAIREARGVFFIACGTSFHACKAAEYFFSKIANRHVNIALASEFSNYENFIKPKSLIIAVSQSGETADVLEAVKAAKKRGAKVLAICNVKGSTLAREADQLLLMNAGPELSVISTKTYTAQLALLMLLACAVGRKVDFGKRILEHSRNSAYNLTARSTREHIKKLAEILRDKKHVFTIGRGLQYPTALEAALKIKEVSYIHAEGFAGGELKHGSIALIEKNTPTIVFASKENADETFSNAQEIKLRGGYIIGVGPENNEVFDFWIKVPESGYANPIAQIIPVQVLAYQLAVLKGYDPDHPRHLAKSVTVK